MCKSCTHKPRALIALSFPSAGGLSAPPVFELRPANRGKPGSKGFGYLSVLRLFKNAVKYSGKPLVNSR